MPQPGEPGRRPHLLVINQYFDTVEASGQVLVEMCEDLASVVDITVLAAKPKRRAETRRPAGVRVIWTRSTHLRKSFLPFRALNYCSFLASVLLAAPRAGRPAVVLCMTDPPVIGLIGLAIARLRRARFLLVCQDVHPEVGVISGRLTSRPVILILRLVQRLLLRGSDHVVAIGRAMRERLVDRGAAPDRVSVIPNWVDLRALRPAPRDNDWATRHALTGTFTVMHSGNVGLMQSLDTLVAAAEEVPDARFVIVGEGSGKDALTARVHENGTRNVSFLPHQPRSELRYSLASADVHVISLVPGLAGFLEPSKIYGVLAAGRPIVAAVDQESETARLVEEARCGLVVPPANRQALVAAIQRLASLPEEERVKMGEAGRAMAEARCGREPAAGAYCRLVTALAGSGC